MKRIRLAVEITLLGPVLTHASGAGMLGVDSPVAIRPDGRCYLPFSLVKGRVRQSWDELGFDQGDEWFGRASAEWSGIRGRLRFSDFEEPDQRTAVGRRHRIRIDDETGAADDGALQVLESPFAAGESAVFNGEISFFAGNGEEHLIRDRIEKAIRWTPSFGAGRTIGFGRLQSVRIANASTSPPASTVACTSGRYAFNIRFSDPFCLARRRIAENLFETDEVIPGSAVRGVAATTLNEILGRSPTATIDASSTSDPAWAALAKHFNEISISHAFPSIEKRPIVPPLSIVRSDANVFVDIALADGPGLIDGKAPQFSIDWKGDALHSLRTSAPWHWPDLGEQKEIRVRTAIDRVSRRAAEAKLFSYEMIQPGDIRWAGTISFENIATGADRHSVAQQFQNLFAHEPAAWGKTKARGRLTLEASLPTIEERFAGPPWVVTLQTPALLCDPTSLDERSDGSALFDAYASAWHSMSLGAVRLVRFFAQQRLAGGYLVHRFRPRESYAPFVLTDAGSVFVLERAGESAEEFIKGISSNRLPVPQWVQSRYGSSWEGNPFLPMDGFGEVVVNLQCHQREIPGFELLEKWKASWQAPEHSAEAPERTPAPHAESAPVVIAQPQPPNPTSFSHRWEITASLQTITDLHIGVGMPLRDRVKRNEPDAPDVEVSAIAVDSQGRAYLPGSALKGALRSWLTAHLPGQRVTIDRLFGTGGDAKTSMGGIVEVHDARATTQQSQIANVPFHDPTRLTGVTASAAIDRRTGAAREEKLFHREYVPAGVTFQLVLTADGMTDEEAALLVFALKAFGNGAQAIRLGAETRDGWGRFTCSSPSIRRITPSDWLAGRKPIDCTSAITAAAANLVASSGIRELRLTITELAFTGPFLVNEPSRTEAFRGKTEPETPDHAPRIGPDGKVVLPVSSLRGALRARAERIVRDLGSHACMATDPASACHAIDTAKKAGQLCLVCQLFGAPGWAAPLAFDPLRLINKPPDYRQELVAIDRFTGGVSGSAKFDVEAAWRPKFRTELAVDLARWDKANIDSGVRNAALGLLLLTLRDLAAGNLFLGLGASKGYGACEATIDWPKDAASFASALHAHLGIVPLGTQVTNVAPLGVETPRDAPSPHAPGGNGAEFFNPYHFVGVAATPGPQSIKAEELKTAAHLSHAKTAPSTFSGRIVCRLTTRTPVVIGAKQERPHAKALATVHPFLHPDTRKPALPATSLRGLIASVAEAASNSALRVLANMPLSYRCTAEDNLTAIGMVAKDRRLIPLTMPSLRESTLEPGFRNLFKKAYLPVSIDGYADVNHALEYEEGTFLRLQRPESFSADQQKRWYLDMRGVEVNFDARSGVVRCNVTSGSACEPHIAVHAEEGNQVEWLLGLRTRQAPIDQESFEALDPDEQKRYTPGILRVLGIDGREKKIPLQKKHELFIPVDPADTGVSIDAREAIALFEQVAALRTDADSKLPFELKGSKRNEKGAGAIKLRPGDLVFFSPNADGTAVERLAISSIWRRTTDGDVHAFFGAVSKELLPFHPDRETVSIAEQMFGFVEVGTDNGRALASRVRPSMGVLYNEPPGGPLLPPVTLKILASPKPPAPAMYFRPRSGPASWIAKRELSVSSHIPRGRKMYLHHAAAWNVATWKSEREGDLGQKSRVTPIAKGSTFLFHLDFDNLTRLELGLLCYALQPNDRFHHKLGMGKAIGLGSVLIEPGLLALNDPARYRKPWDPSANRHDRCEILLSDARDWPKFVSGVTSLPSPADDERFAVLRGEFRQAMKRLHPDIPEALELIGDPTRWRLPIHTPQLLSEDVETKTFRWFMQNDRQTSVHQALGQLDARDPAPLNRTIRTRPKESTGQTRNTASGTTTPTKRTETIEKKPSPTAPRRGVPGSELWTNASLSYDARNGLLTATRLTGEVATRSALPDDPTVQRIAEGLVKADVYVRLMPNKSRTIVREILP